MKDEIVNSGYDSKRLEKIYEVCNKIFKGKDNLFYTKEEVEELKTDDKNIFLERKI